MLDVSVSSPGYELDDALHQHVTDSFGTLDEFMDTLGDVRVTFAWEGGHGEQTKVHAHASAPGHQFEASHTDWTATTAADQTRRELETQIRREHGKRISERRRR
ncbi:MAG: HPF/RaiA family ribosome-associated protein [Acidimicrobiia bacterium]|nr:HPF/RaiA family ribosome-associated protein [Acidimicrobiia bacterium]